MSHFLILFLVNSVKLWLIYKPDPFHFYLFCRTIFVSRGFLNETRIGQFLVFFLPKGNLSVIFNFESSIVCLFYSALCGEKYLSMCLFIRALFIYTHPSCIHDISGRLLLPTAPILIAFPVATMWSGALCSL